jgi:TonB family protein
MPTWRLLPPCALLFVLPFAVLPRAGAQATPAAGDQPPELIQHDPAGYPSSLEGTGAKGHVLLTIFIDPNGQPVLVEPVESTHPDFEAIAVKAALHWTYKPALRGGIPVTGRMEAPFSFTANVLGSGIYRDGFDVFHFPRTSPASLPPQFYYDQPPVPTLVNAPVYPLDLLEKHVEGKATVTYAIDTKGRPHLFRIDNATDPEFAAAAGAMVLSWQFKPARLAGNASWALVTRQETFEIDEGDFPVSTVAQRLLRELGRSPCPIVRTGLDQAPLPRFHPRMRVPDALLKARSPAKAVVEIVVDEEGHAQLPRVVSATDPDFGWAAMTAVARWIYTPPTQNGKPVAAFIQVPFSWAPSPAPRGT